MERPAVSVAVDDACNVFCAVRDPSLMERLPTVFDNVEIEALRVTEISPTDGDIVKEEVPVGDSCACIKTRRVVDAATDRCVTTKVRLA
jgi:hypothetical protein